MRKRLLENVITKKVKNFLRKTSIQRHIFCINSNNPKSLLDVSFRHCCVPSVAVGMSLFIYLGILIFLHFYLVFSSPAVGDQILRKLREFNLDQFAFLKRKVKKLGFFFFVNDSNTHVKKLGLICN